MKKLLTAFAVTAMAIAGATFASLAMNQSAYANPAADACIKAPGGINVNKQNANVDVKLDKGCGQHKFVMKAWYAPSASGIPHEEQRLFAMSETLKMSPSDGVKHLNVKMLPEGCFYQVDLVDVTNPATNGDGNPIVAAVTGGNRDCTPQPVFSCNSMSAKPGANRTITIDSFNFTAENATLSKVTVQWDSNDPNSANTYPGSPLGATHQYAADGTYTISAAAFFTVKGKNGEDKVKVANKACVAQVTVTTPKPGEQQVCDLTTSTVVNIPEGPYDTTKYAPVGDIKCNPVVTPPTPPTTTVTSETPETELVKTGPGSVVAMFGAIVAIAMIGRQLVLRRR